jgi:amino acid transporter
MKYFEKNEDTLLQRSFAIGLVGILLCLVVLYQNYSPFVATGIITVVNGLGLGAQLFAMSIAVLVMRKRKIKEETKEKAKKMTLVLAVSLIFFFLAV